MGRKKGGIGALGDAVAAIGEGKGGLGAAWVIIKDNHLEPAVGGLGIVLVLVGLLSWRFVRWAELEALHWDLLLSCVALVFNIFLCSFQMIILMNLHELSQDHVNQFDVEVSIKRMVVPERFMQVPRFPNPALQSEAISMVISLIHLCNGAWFHLLLQVPITGWHAYCIARGIVPVRALLGRGEEFARDMRRARREHYGKAALYGMCLVLLVVRVCPLAVRSIMGAKLFQAYLGRVFGGGRELGEKAAQRMREYKGRGEGSIS